MDLSEVECFVELDEVSQAYLKAADLIDQHGLAKHLSEDGLGRLCILGALSKALRGNAMGTLADEFSGLWERWNKYSGTESCISVWNDHPSRTKQEVVSKLREVALS